MYSGYTISMSAFICNLNNQGKLTLPLLSIYPMFLGPQFIFLSGWDQQAFLILSTLIP